MPNKYILLLLISSSFLVRNQPYLVIYIFFFGFRDIATIEDVTETEHHPSDYGKR